MKWGDRAELAITHKLRQLHLSESYQPKHWHVLTDTEKICILESHVYFGSQEREDIVVNQMIDGNEKHDWITKQEWSSTTESTGAFVLLCIVDTWEESNVVLIDIPPNGGVATIIL